MAPAELARTHLRVQLACEHEPLIGAQRRAERSYGRQFLAQDDELLDPDVGIGDVQLAILRSRRQRRRALERGFDRAATRDRAPAVMDSGDEPLLGSADIQSLADLGNSFELVRSMRFAPITRDAVVQLLVITLLPVVPLLLTMVPLHEIMRTLVKVLM